MAKKDLVELLIKLFGDPKLHDQVRQDPDGALRKLGLTQEEIKLFRSRDEQALRDYLGKDAARILIVTSWLPGDKK